MASAAGAAAAAASAVAPLERGYLLELIASALLSALASEAVAWVLIYSKPQYE